MIELVIGALVALLGVVYFKGRSDGKSRLEKKILESENAFKDKVNDAFAAGARVDPKRLREPDAHKRVDDL